jgi:hypothetical protein
MPNSDFLLNLGGAQFRYDPYPIGIIRNIFESSRYMRLANSFPANELFRFMQYHGDKWSLSEINNPEKYHDFLRTNSDWKELYEEVKSKKFIDQVLDTLIKSKINLGLVSGVRDDFWRRLKKLFQARKVNGELTARFEFSMMSANGGYIYPHTDSPQKLITLVLSMSRPGEWDESWGGGTDMMRPLDASDNFNFMNRYLGFNEVDVIQTMAYEPNQCVIFIKTFNSLHAVRPMSGPRDVMRRTLTINIEST